jgi:hypothetical protein
MAPQDHIFQLSKEDEQASWAPAVLAMAERARARVEKRTGFPLRGPVRIVTFGNSLEFYRYLESQPMGVVAVARPEDHEIVIDRPAWLAAGPVEQQRTLVHEMVHLTLDQRVRGPLPRWIEEGIAMLAAGQGGYAEGWRVMVAATLGNLLPLERLERQVATGDSLQELAYAESLAVTRYYLGRAYAEPSHGGRDPAPLIQDLADPRTGPRLLARLWDPFFRDSLEYQWRRSQKTLWTWIAVLTGGSFLWFILSMFFLLTYWRKRRLVRLARERFDQDDRRDAELGLATPPWEYGAYEDPDLEDSHRTDD